MIKGNNRTTCYRALATWDSGGAILLEDQNKTLSIIIPTKNEGDALEKCLDSVFSQSVEPLEVIVVDGGSSDNTLDIAGRFNARIIKEGRFRSPANARNLGARAANGQILLLMDADVVLQENCLRFALELFSDVNVIAVIPSGLACDDSYLELIQRRWNEGSRTSRNIGLRKAKTSGLVAFFRKEVFGKVEFDTAYGFGEDDDFSTRLEREFVGRLILVAENSRVIAHSPHTVKELATRYMWWGRTFFAYLTGHLNLRSFLNMGSLVLPTLVMFTFLASLLFPGIRVVSVFFFSVLIARILATCIRSRSALFFQFIFFDLVRSFFFSVGLTQSLFVNNKGR